MSTQDTAYADHDPELPTSIDDACVVMHSMPTNSCAKPARCSPASPFMCSIGTAQLILQNEKAARLRAIAEQIGDAQPYIPEAIELQWQRTGLLERARLFQG